MKDIVFRPFPNFDEKSGVLIEEKPLPAYSTCSDVWDALTREGKTPSEEELLHFLNELILVRIHQSRQELNGSIRIHHLDSMLDHEYFDLNYQAQRGKETFLLERHSPSRKFRRIVLERNTSPRVAVTLKLIPPPIN